MKTCLFPCAVRCPTSTRRGRKSTASYEHPGIRTVLHLGDFGIGRKARDRNFLDVVDYWCRDAGIERILVTPGNHEDWDYLDTLLAASPGQRVSLSKTVTALPRGFAFTLAGRAFLSFGGAASVDYASRTAGFDWFLTEAPHG